MQGESCLCRAGSGAGYTPTACTLSNTGASFASVEGTSFWAPRVAPFTALQELALSPGAEQRASGSFSIAE